MDARFKMLNDFTTELFGEPMYDDGFVFTEGTDGDQPVPPHRVGIRGSLASQMVAMDIQNEDDRSESVFINLSLAEAQQLVDALTAAIAKSSGTEGVS